MIDLAGANRRRGTARGDEAVKSGGLLIVNGTITAFSVGNKVAMPRAGAQISEGCLFEDYTRLAQCARSCAR
jgi:hypothetical protein